VVTDSQAAEFLDEKLEEGSQTLFEFAVLIP
jgi:hypothetical protein